MPTPATSSSSMVWVSLPAPSVFQIHDEKAFRKMGNGLSLPALKYLERHAMVLRWERMMRPPVVLVISYRLHWHVGGV
jgi:hypothetical protein